MASDSEATCEEDPNFAAICAFFEKFGQLIGITDVDFCELQSMLENTHEVPKFLSELHIKLLRKVKKKVIPEKWEKSLIKFCHTFSNIDAWELERFGYKKAKLSSKVRVLKELLDAQFDQNTKFKLEINKITSTDLRSQPLGRDKFGHAYWFQSDDNYQIRVYKEDADLDDEKWTLVAKDKTGLVSLISHLKDGDIKVSSDSAGNEDSNSLSEKPIIDTGQQDTDSKRTSDDEDSNLMETNVEQEKESLDKVKETEEKECKSEDISQETEEKEYYSDNKVQENEEKECESENMLQETEAKECENENKVQETKDKECENEEEEPDSEDNDDRLVIEEDEDVEEKEADSTQKAQEDGKTELTETKQESLKSPVNEEKGVPESDEEENTENEEESSEELKTNLKRPRENDTEDSETSAPKPKIPNLALENTKEPVVGEAIEEPVMTVEGEGSGSDNQCPIIGEAIEEEIFFVHGNGSGVDCQTGNNSDTESTNVETTKDNSGILKEQSLKDNTEISNSTEESVETVEKENGNDECESEISLTISDNKLLPKASENNISNSNNSSNSEENLGEPQPKGTIELEEGKTELDVNNLSDKTEAPEPVCIKRTAYICGEENKDLPIENNASKAENGKEAIIESDEDTKNNETVKDANTNENDIEEQIAKEEDQLVRPIKKAAKGAQRKHVAKAESEDKAGEENQAGNSAESSIPNSPQSANDNSIQKPGKVAAETISENKDAEAKTSEVKPTLTSFSLDFNESPTPTTPIEKPSPLRALRKRGINVVPTKPQEPEEGKRLKLKGRRSVDAALRRSVEQRIEQLHGSSSDSKDSEEEQQAKTKKAGRFVKKKSPKKEDNEEENQDSKSKESNAKKISPKPNPEKKYSRMLVGLKIDEDDSNDRPLRQSRRIAQLKIKEQAKPRSQIAQEARERQRLDDEKRKNEPESEEEDEEEYSGTEAKKSEKKKKKKKEKPVMFNEKRPWQSSSEDSEDAAEEEEEEMIDEEDDAPSGPLQSDHEFSPESEDDDGEEWTPVKRARTARKESDAEPVDDFPCQKCIKSDHPEWILLCDKCDSGWHCSCLRPPLLVIPEGDWFCPPCQHIILLERLQAKLVEYDKKLSKKEIEDRRKERLAYVGISLNNVLPTKEPASDHRKKKKRRLSSDEVSESSDVSESESEDSDEPIYQLRQRRQTKSYKFNEYDDLIKDAIGEDITKTEDSAGNLGRGKDIQTIVKGLEEEKEEEKKAKEENKKVEERPTTANLKKMLRKKHRKLNCLDFDSEEEDISDEDFKGSSESEEEEDDDASVDSEDSDDYVGKKRRKHAPVRRSTRARTRKYDEDFINDDTDYDAPKKKKKTSIWDETESDESDASGYGKRKFKKKKNKKVTKDNTKKNRRIKYGGLTSSEEENFATGRRTRGKKATYVDTLGTDESEVEESVTKKNPRRIISDDDHDEDFVANEEDEVEDEKDSEEKVEDDEEEADEEEYDSEEEERRKKLPLIVPKIYIKKPLGPKRDTPPQGGKPLIPEMVEPEKIPSGFVKSDANVQLSSAIAKTKSTDSVKEILKSNIEARLSEAGIQLSKLKNIDEMAPRQQKCELLAAALKKPTAMHEPIVSNVSALIKNDSENEDLSEPPGIALPTFDEIRSDFGNCGESPKKRKGRPPKKKPEDVMNLSGKNPEPAIEIAAPPQPFSQAQPTPSVITRMLQSKPGISLYPVGRIRPKQFATMRDDDSDESSPKNSPSPTAPHVGQYPGAPPRGNSPMPYRHPPPPAGMYPRGPPPGIRGPPPHAFSHHRPPLGPSPSGGGPINLSEQGQPRGGPPINRYPAPVSQPPPGPRPPLHLYRPPPTNNGPPYVPPPPVSTNGPPPPPHQPYPPPVLSNNGQPAPLQPYPPGPNSQPQPYPATVETPAGAPSPTPPVPEGYYSTYPQPPPVDEDLPPPATYEGLPPEPGPSYQEPYVNDDQSPSATPADGNNGKNYEEESGGEFAGLASYFSSQREDDLES
ncbi:unnamed protein product [Ceutorhynchus assimilis]|uniref:Remodeling and spacing factor 1 n=1 Tax=Ceutorhynchus assimilis TaxID=467358 RepID=A0A9P0DDU3_9CUCU|nr:unnamed protein product [Ceutorhynchus assimilis]